MDCSLFRVTCACSCNPRVPSTCSQARKGKELWRFKYEDFEALRQLWKEPLGRNLPVGLTGRSEKRKRYATIRGSRESLKEGNSSMFLLHD